MSANPLEPVVAPQTPAQPPTGSPAQTRNALHEKVGGDWGKAETTYFSAVNELKRTHEVAEKAIGRVQQLEAAVAAMSGGGQPANQDPLAMLQEELGLPAEPLGRAIDSRLDSRLESRLTELFAPLISEMQAGETLAAEIPNFNELKASARAFMNDQPDVAEVFNAVKAANKPAEAWKFAIRSMLTAQNGQAAPTPRPDLGLPNGRTMQGRSEPNPAGPDQRTKEAQALEYGRNYGNMDHYAHERFQGTSVSGAVEELLRSVGLAGPPAGTGW
jgi:hypothetical protein